MHHQTVAHQAVVQKLVNLLDLAANVIFNMSSEEAAERVGSGDPRQIRQIDGQFALLHQHGTMVRMARSIGRPMRYFMAKRAEGPCLIVAERIDEISDYLRGEGLHDQFHPSYTRMVPAHHLTEIALVGCPDPNPVYQRFVTSPDQPLNADLDEIGGAYVGAVADKIDQWLDSIDMGKPIGVLFSGGIDSGAIFLLTYHRLLARGEAPTRLKAFTLDIDGTGADSEQAAAFLAAVDLSMFLETLAVPRGQLDYQEAIRVVEDYKPLDVQSATMALALCQGIRQRYPDWKHLIDGDGGDENLRDYPIEENPELTIRSVLGNPFFYHEGWGVDKMKHSLTYSGGQSRGHVRTYAPARKLGFTGFSPFATPNVIAVAEQIPFVELTGWDHDRLYDLKGQVTRRGVEQVTGITMPIFEKRRFQRGAVGKLDFDSIFPSDDQTYRKSFAALYE